MNGKFLVGFVVLILGFVAYRLGVAINIAKNSLVGDFVMNYAPNGISIDLLGILLEFGGGILLLFGIVISVTALSKAKKVRYTAVKDTQAKPPIEVIRCKFCSTELGDSSFCPECGKSQE